MNKNNYNIRTVILSLVSLIRLTVFTIKYVYFDLLIKGLISRKCLFYLYPPRLTVPNPEIPELEISIGTEPHNRDTIQILNTHIDM